MSFIIYDLVFLVVFSIAIAIFLYMKKRKLQREGTLYLYKTSIGLKLIDYIGKKFRKTLKVLSYVSIVCGYVLMLASFYLIYQLIVIFLKPEVVKLVKMPPIMPLIPYLPELFKIEWLPPFYFTYWIVAIALVAIFHEGFHGIFARLYNIKIKSTGFGFLGPFLAFFVEQDDKQMKKAKPFAQMAVLSAGVFANVILGILFFVLMAGFFSAAYAPSGVIFNDYSYAVAPLSYVASQAVILNETFSVDGLNLTKIQLDGKNYLASSQISSLDAEAKYDNKTNIKLYYDFPAIRQAMRGAIRQINDYSIESTTDISLALSESKPGDEMKIGTEYEEGKETVSEEYVIKLGADYSNESRAVLGIATLQANTGGFKAFLYRLINTFKDPNVYYLPKAAPELTLFIYTLLWWIFVINLSVAIANMIPAGIFDGGRFFYLTIFVITGNGKIAEKAFKYVTLLLIATIVFLMLLWIRGIF